ncbi:MAG: XrtA/PEP-CTERM system exopolysaccharide export protein [Gammaproteobacteria bacterium]
MKNVNTLRPNWIIFWMGLAGSLLLLAGCGSAGVPGVMPAASAPTEHYIIGPGDSLEIYVRDNPNLTTTVPVRPDGRISIPLVQSMVAAGKTPEELAHDLQVSLSRYIREPLVTVIVKSFVGAYSQQVRVVGQAAMPKAVPYRSGMSLLDVMIEVGGLTKFADGNDAKIIRRLPDGSELTIPVKLGNLMNGAIKYNVVMHPGDILIIPESLF